MASFMQPDDSNDRVASIPRDLPMLPLRNTVAYPFSVLPLVVGIPRSVKLIEDALQGNRLIGLVSMKDGSIEEPLPGQVYEIGTVAMIHRVVRAPDNTLQVVVQGLERLKVEYWLGAEPYLRAHISLAPDIVPQDVELEALERSLRELAQEVIALAPNMPEDAGKFLDQVQDPRYLAYLISANSRLEVAEGQKILEMDNVKDKFRALMVHLTREKEVLTLGQKIQSEAREEMDKAQREYYLRQQLRAIQKELGEADESQVAADDYRKKIEDAGLPEEAKKEALRELKRLEGMPPQAAEHSVIKTYLDWLIELPWNKLSEDQLDIVHARQVLDEDHYDLQEVKDRILEFLAVRKLVQERGVRAEPGEEEKVSEAMGAILCFVGPPGVGKTSLGQSIARALGRKFTRMSLGGMRDEAEIRGHRRTYIGALPGRIIQAIKRASTRNPVFMLDEVDKIGNDWRGDPSSALLEVLDPAQNHAFRDHYLDVDFDLSDVIFITTANTLETIPPPLRDRMEIIQLDGYTEYEKIKIAQGFLVPRQVKANGLREGEVTFSEEALRKTVQDYTREAGVRNLERQIGTICRKSAVKIAAGEVQTIAVTPEIVREYLKRERFESEASEAIEIPGIATGLAVTAVGGDILFIEATRMRGKGGLTLTGQLGDVMRESAQIAHSYVRSKAQALGVNADIFEQTDVHIHVPAGAVPKDGPSAGITMVTAMASLFSGRPVRSDVGMTGEVTLRGRVLPIGGVKMKVLAAHRAGLTTVILPKRNERDLEDLPDDVRQAMTFVPVDRIDEALAVALLPVEIKEPEALAASNGRQRIEELGMLNAE
ncbi:endopeptidase La [Candidatus Amarolinea aalborgensis]|jgi:ATP-dependent Lon protease|uniref:endopeptidase La n=1 Tax=Candidatus Amarolinea aalborgensis TaxID=2249329 RepID=UPI003BF9CD73